MSVEQWLRSFDDAEFVLTDSFHGCVFSIIFRKQFLAVGNKKRGLSRFDSLLTLFSLQDRLILSPDKYKNNLSLINYNQVQGYLRFFQDQSLSIIVPVYNAEKYIQQCIRSILNQSYSDLEIILVDDGSSDSSASLCQELAQKDARIQYYYQPNSGVTSARKKGVELSSGEYVTFVDADDTIEKDFLEVLVDKITEGFDMVISGASLEGEMDGDTFVSKILEGKLPPSIWGRLIKREILSDEVFNISRDLPIGEDVIMNILIGLRIHHSIYVHNKNYYNYEIHDTSVMNGRVVTLAYDEAYIEKIRETLGDRLQDFWVSYLRLKLHCLENLIVSRIKIPYQKDWIRSTLQDAKKLDLSCRERMVTYVHNSFLCRYLLAIERRLRLMRIKK